MNLRFGIYILRNDTRELLRDGTPVTMTPKSFAVLQVLVQAHGKTVSKEELMAAVWPDSYVDEGSVSQNIFVLRKLRAADFSEMPPIETVARSGYRFRTPVEEIVETPAPPIEESEVPPIETVPSPELVPSGLLIGFLARHRGWTALLATLLLLVGGAGGYLLYKARSEAQADDRKGSIAVLTLRNLTGDPQNAWLSMALREMLATDLTTGTGLKLLPEETVKRAQEELGLQNADGLNAATLSKLRDDLDCDRVISGSYAVIGGRIHLDLHLMDARSGAQIASYSMNEGEDQLQALVETGGRSLRHQLGVAPRTYGENAAIEATLPTSVEAYRFYVEGQQAINEYDSLHARELLTQSIAIDPNYALSHAALGTAYQMSGQQTKANEEADRAVSLAGNLSRLDQLNVQAEAQNIRHQFQASADTFHTLMGISPDNLTYGVLYARDLVNAGRSHEALAELDRLMARPGPEATDPRLYSTVADAWGTLGDWPRSLEWASKAAAESKRRGARISYGRVLTSVSQAHMYLKQYDLATAETNESLGIAREFRDYSAELRALNRLAQIDLAQSKLNEAQAILTQALNREQALGEQQRQIHTLGALGKVMTRKGQYAEAMSYYNREVQVATAFGQAEFLLSAQYNQAVGRRDTGDISGAQRQLETVVAEAMRIDDKQTRLDALGTLAEVREKQGQHKAALANIRAALQVADFDSTHASQFRLLDLQTRALLNQGQLSAAATSLNQEQTLLVSLKNDDASHLFEQTRDLVHNGAPVAIK